MKRLYQKLPSESFAKKLLISALIVFVLCIVASLIVLFKLYSVAGINRENNIPTPLDTYQTVTHILVWTARLSIAIMVIAGVILAIQHEKGRSRGV